MNNFKTMFLDYVMIHPSKKLTWNLKSFLLKRQIILQTFNLWVQNVKFQVRIPFFHVDVLSQTPQQSTVKGKKRCWSQGASSKQPPSAASINMYLGSVKSGEVALVGTWPRDLSGISHDP